MATLELNVLVDPRKHWADEVNQCEPDPRLEPFFVMAAIEFGDPDMGKNWLMGNAVKFYAMLRLFDATCDGPTALIQYLVWYERERANLTRRPGVT